MMGDFITGTGVGVKDTVKKIYLARTFSKLIFVVGGGK